MGVSLSSCDNESQAQNTQQSTSGPISNDKTSQNVIDSLSNFKAELDSISKESKEAVSKVENMEGSVSKIKGKEIWLWGAILIVCVISLILFVICLRLYSNLRNQVDRYCFDIEKLKNIKQEVAPRTVERAYIPSDYESLKHKIYNLELQIKQLLSRQIQYSQAVSPTASTGMESTSSKSGYFGNPISAVEPYFKKIFGSRDSEARFSVEISGDKAIFKPIESSDYIGTLISNDAMRAAIEFQGFTPGERPSSMRVIMPGEAVYRDNRWFITKKAQVYLS